MDESWVCGSCKSINRARERRCYKCHGERDEALTTGGTERRTIDAVANRTVRDYLPTWPLAVLAGGLLVAVAVLGVLILLRTSADFPAMRDAFVVALASGGAGLDVSAFTQSAETAFLGLLRGGLVLLALVSFAAWLAIATMNVPALGGGVPSRSPLRVFVYTLIPLWNLIKVPGMVQDVLYRLDSRAGGAWMVMAATIGLVGSWFVSLIGSWVIVFVFVRDMFDAATLEQQVAAFGSTLDQSFWLSVVTELMITVGTLLLVVLMVRIEQRVAARNREVGDVLDTLAAGPGSGAPVVPGSGAPVVPGSGAPVVPAAPPVPTASPAGPTASPAAPSVPSAPAGPAQAAPATFPHGFQVVGRSPSATDSPPAAPPPPPPPPGAPPA